MLISYCVISPPCLPDPSSSLKLSIGISSVSSGSISKVISTSRSFYGLLWLRASELEHMLSKFSFPLWFSMEWPRAPLESPNHHRWLSDWIVDLVYSISLSSLLSQDEPKCPLVIQTVLLKLQRYLTRWFLQIVLTLDQLVLPTFSQVVRWNPYHLYKVQVIL